MNVSALPFAVLASVALLAPQLAAPPALARPPQREVEIAFRLAPADLASEPATRALFDRVQRFARAECDSGSHYTAMAEYDCRRAIEEQLVRRIGDARLARIAGIRLG